MPIKGFIMVTTEHIDNVRVAGRMLSPPLTDDLSQRHLSVALQRESAPLRHDVYPSCEPLRVYLASLRAKEPRGLNVGDQQVEGVVQSAVLRLK